MDFIIAALVAGGAGIALVVMQALNAGLGVQLASPLWAGLANYIVSAATIGVVLVVFREPWPLAAAGRVSPQFWLGGAFGTLYVLASIFMLRRLGAGTLVALLVAGQMIGSLVVDHFGLFGVKVHPIDMTRMAGAALLVGGVLLIRQ
jgi:bacterial/archaeal transporter family-2 protein